MGETGVSDQITGSAKGRVADPVTGRFAPGNATGGRKPKAVERAYLDAVKEGLPPDEVASLIREALELARRQNSWRGMAEVLQLALAYGAGKPVNRVQTSDGNLAALLDALGQGQPAAGGAGGATSPGSDQGRQQQAGTAGELTDDERGGE